MNDDVFRFMPINNEQTKLRIIVCLDKYLNIAVELTTDEQVDIKALYQAIIDDGEFRKFVKVNKLIGDYIRDSKVKMVKTDVKYFINELGLSKPNMLIIYPGRAGYWFINDETNANVLFSSTVYAKK